MKTVYVPVNGKKKFPTKHKVPLSDPLLKKPKKIHNSMTDEQISAKFWQEVPQAFAFPAPSIRFRLLYAEVVSPDPGPPAGVAVFRFSADLQYCI